MLLYLLACKAPVDLPPDDPPTPRPTLPWTDLSDTVERERTDARVPALAGAIIGPDGLIAYGIAGNRQRGADDPVDWDDRFHLGSLTKSMTGTLAARIVEQGDLDWDTPIEALWPDAHVGWHGVTLTHLLKHQSGAAENPNNAQFLELIERNGQDTAASRAWLADAVLAEAPPNPRDDYQYSNTGILLAGAMIEATDGRNWEVSLQQEVFTPLGITRCGYGPPIDDGPWGHLGPTPVDPTEPGADNPTAFGPAGTVSCPMEDYSSYLVAHLVRDESLLSAASWEALHTPATGDYAAGWAVLEQPWTNGPALSHNGSNGAWLASAWVAPGIDRAYVVLTNRADANADDAVQSLLLALIQRED